MEKGAASNRSAAMIRSEESGSGLSKIIQFSFTNAKLAINLYKAYYYAIHFASK